MTRVKGLEAAQIVMNELRFVGLTEDVALSVLLFHAVFGGVRHGHQFENVRPGNRRFQHHARMSIEFRYDDHQLDGWFDPLDDDTFIATLGKHYVVGSDSGVVKLYDRNEIRDGLEIRTAGNF